MTYGGELHTQFSAFRFPISCAIMNVLDMIVIRFLGFGDSNTCGYYSRNNFGDRYYAQG